MVTMERVARLARPRTSWSWSRPGPWRWSLATRFQASQPGSRSPIPGDRMTGVSGCYGSRETHLPTSATKDGKLMTGIGRHHAPASTDRGSIHVDDALSVPTPVTTGANSYSSRRFEGRRVSRGAGIGGGSRSPCRGVGVSAPVPGRSGGHPWRSPRIATCSTESSRLQMDFITQDGADRRDEFLGAGEG